MQIVIPMSGFGERFRLDANVHWLFSVAGQSKRGFETRALYSQLCQLANRLD